jgi:cytochrome c5
MNQVHKLVLLGVVSGAFFVLSAGPVVADSGQEIYEETCELCHGEGLAGAPAFGDKEAWAPRIEQGMDTLIEHAINGFEGESGIMPEKGGDPDIEDDDIAAIVKYMVDAAK